MNLEIERSELTLDIDSNDSRYSHRQMLLLMRWAISLLLPLLRAQSKKILILSIGRSASVGHYFCGLAPFCHVLHKSCNSEKNLMQKWLVTWSFARIAAIHGYVRIYVERGRYDANENEFSFLIYGVFSPEIWTIGRSESENGWWRWPNVPRDNPRSSRTSRQGQSKQVGEPWSSGRDIECAVSVVPLQEDLPVWRRLKALLTRLDLNPALMQRTCFASTFDVLATALQAACYYLFTDLRALSCEERCSRIFKVFELGVNESK